MSDLQFYFYAAMVGFIGYIAFSTIFTIISFIRKGLKFKKTYNKYPRAVPATNTCTHKKEHHKYASEPINFALNDGIVGDYLPCVKCGFLVGTEYKLSAAGIEAILELEQKREIRTKQNQEIIEKFADNVIKELRPFFKENGLDLAHLDVIEEVIKEKF